MTIATRLVKALIIPTDSTQPARLGETLVDLDSLKTVLDGGWLEGIGGDGWSAYVDEEGKIKGLPANLRATHLARTLGWNPGDILCGPVVFLGPVDNQGDETSITDDVVGVARACGCFLP